MTAEEGILCGELFCEATHRPDGDLTELAAFSRFRICFVTEGTGFLAVLGREIPCSAGDVCIVPPGVPHEFFSTEAAALRVRILEFDLSRWFEGNVCVESHPEYCHGVFRDSAVIAYASLHAGMRERVAALYASVAEELAEKKRGWRELVRSYLVELLVRVSRYMDSAIKEDFSFSAKEWRVTSRVIRAVGERFGDSDLTLEKISASLYLSQSRVSRAVQKTLGIPFSRYLCRVRIRRVCELLGEGRRVWDAAVASGFRDRNTFYRAFLAEVGTTPGEYRRIHSAQAGAKELQRKSTKQKEKIMVVLREISELVQKGRAKLVKEMVAKALEEGANPEEILNEGLLHGMSVVGEQFKNNEIYVPEVLVAARAMNMGSEILKPHLAAKGVVATGKVCIGTVQGDLHDIGKNLVKMMMEGKGLEVVDLGTDVAPETFVRTAIEENCQVICCSALLTTTMDVMADVVKAAEAAGIRDRVKIMIGGAPVSEEFCQKIGADCYTVDAASAADMAAEFCKE
jgi:corrinoid protein of di/trimethylamine methyltransferase